MSDAVFPTKGNLIATKKSLSLAIMGYDLMDKKRNILIREMMLLVDKAKLLRDEISETYQKAYLALQHANMKTGVTTDIAECTSFEDGISINYRSVMGVDIPEVSFSSTINDEQYGIYQSNSQFDIAYINFTKAKELTITLAEVENSVYRLANAIKKTQRRANALKNINIPHFTEVVKFISDALEEKEREEFSRLKVIRHQKNEKAEQENN